MFRGGINTMIDIVILINLITILVFIVGFVLNTKQGVQPKIKANFGVFMGISTVAYLLSMIFVAIIGLIKGQYLWLNFLIFVIIPFVIGKFVQYKTMKFYSVLQIICFIASFVLLFWVR